MSDLIENDEEAIDAAVNALLRAHVMLEEMAALPLMQDYPLNASRFRFEALVARTAAMQVIFYQNNPERPHPKNTEAEDAK